MLHSSPVVDGLDPDDPPTTFDELESVVRQLRDSGAAATGMVLYDRAASWLVEQAAAQEGRLLVEPANGREGTSVTDLVFDTPEAVATLEQIERGGPFPYDRDGSVFQNRERHLPDQPRGYYREYTVATPGARDRGARRIVTGGQPPEVYYYTDDHYRSFRRVEVDR